MTAGSAGSSDAPLERWRERIYTMKETMKKIFLHIVFGLLVISTIFNVLFFIGVSGGISSQWFYICIGAVMLFNAVYSVLPPREQYVFDWFNFKGYSPLTPAQHK